MADKNTPVVAFVGLGSMGLGMAKNLLKHGHKVIGVDPSAPAREAFAAAGGTIAATPGEAAAAADALVVAVVNAQQVETVLYGEGGGVAKLRKGGMVMQCATVPAAFAKSLGERLAKSGHELLDAPMSGGRARAEFGRAHLHGLGLGQGVRRRRVDPVGNLGQGLPFGRCSRASARWSRP